LLHYVLLLLLLLLLLCYVFLLLHLYILIFMYYRSGYSVSLCRSVYCSCVNVYRATATRCQPICS